MIKNYVRNQTCSLSYTCVLTNFAFDYLHVLLDIRNNNPSIVCKTNWTFLFISKNYSHIIQCIFRAHWLFNHHEDVFVLYLVKLPFAWLSIEIIFFILVCLRWFFRLFSSFFVVFLLIFTWSSWWIDRCFEYLVLRRLLSWFSKFSQLFFHVCFIEIDRNFCISVRNVRIRWIWHNNHDIINIRHLNPSTFYSNLSTLY